MTGLAHDPADREHAHNRPGGLADALHVCPTCRNEGMACENHPEKAWPDACDCGPGIPCPTCCDPIPQDGTVSITDAFTPRHLRT